MFMLILCFLYTTFATSEQTIYSRVYLRGVKKLETERLQAEWITRGFTYIEDAVITAAKHGSVKYVTEPFEGCEAYSQRSDGIDKDLCENVLTGLRALVSERFPDSDLLYNPKTKRYMLKWD